MSLLTKLRSLVLGNSSKPNQMQLEPAGQKILVLGLAKSGTSILMYRIANGLEERKEYFEPRGPKGGLDVDFHQKVCFEPGNVVTKIVFQPGKPHRLSEILPLYDKVIWIHRDPRDRIISAFLYVWFKGHNPKPERFEKALSLTKQKEQDPGSIPFYELMKTSFTEKIFERMYTPVQKVLKEHQGQILEIKYESFILGEFTTLENYLGFAVDGEAEVKDRVKRVRRSKGQGNWRRWFTPEDVTFFAPLVNPYLNAFGYDTDDWALETVDQLEPKIGSEYMERLYRGE